jgi:hypothetical protein
LKYSGGIVMLIDPFSLGTVRGRFCEQLSRDPKDAGASDADPDDIYSRMMEFLEHHKLRVGAGKARIPVAVVVTKRDAFELHKEFERAVRLEHEMENKAAAAAGRAPQAVNDSRAVRRWLLDQNLAGVVNKLESQFAVYRYFSCSVLGRPLSEASRSSLAPLGVDEPLLWIIRAMDARKAN